MVRQREYLLSSTGFHLRVPSRSLPFLSLFLPSFLFYSYARSLLLASLFTLVSTLSSVPPCSLFPRIYTSNGSITLSSRSGIRIQGVPCKWDHLTNTAISKFNRGHCNFFVFTLRYSRVSYDTTCGIDTKCHFEDNLDSLSEKDLGNLFYRHSQRLVNQPIFVATSRQSDGAWKIVARVKRHTMYYRYPEIYNFSSRIFRRKNDSWGLILFAIFNFRISVSCLPRVSISI